jgi:ubiquinone/menaquinone biosynthesis C-methylase UbiE
MDRLLIRDAFDRRSARYGVEDDWYQRCAERAVELAVLQDGWHVLDIATGTGLAALHASEKVGQRGNVVGIDISGGMLGQAERGRCARGINNVYFEERDAQDVRDYGKRFDAILCVSAMAYFPDPSATLRNWMHVVKGGGRIVFTALESGAFVTSAIFSRIAAAAGVIVPDLTGPLSSTTRCLEACTAAGLRDARVSIEVFPRVIRSTEVAWQFLLDTPAAEEVRNLSTERLRAMRDAFERDLAALVVAGRVIERPPCEFVVATVPYV